MAIDLQQGGRLKRNHIRRTKSTNVYLKLLIKLYKFLARRTGSKFNKAILKRLNSTNTGRYPISISRIAKIVKGKETKVVVAPTTITNDIRFLTVPKLTIAALRFTESARKRIVAAGGKCLTFDQLALQFPTGSGC